MTSAAASQREWLPNRRDGRCVRFAFDGHFYAVHYSRFSDGRPAELFVTLYGKGAVGSRVEAEARDAAILVSLLLQYGVALDDIIASMTASSPTGSRREGWDEPATIIGAALRVVRDDRDDPEPDDPEPDDPAPATPVVGFANEETIPPVPAAFLGSGVGALGAAP
jgi:hypothetical protein